MIDSFYMLLKKRYIYWFNYNLIINRNKKLSIILYLRKLILDIITF